MTLLDLLAWAAVCATVLSLALLIPFALHRLALLRVARTGRGARRADPPAGPLPDPLPPVTVQLPIYNEAGVVDRLLDAVADFDYPRDLLEIQVLDDSTDETSERVARRVADLSAEGLRIRHLRRESREGFKAGALEAGRNRASGAFLLILDADFVPGPGLIRDLLPPFGDPRTGMVQARWEHLNEDESHLTRSQAVLLDGHFFFEQGGRHAAGRFMSFNGTAGMWRAEALESAGGWSAATLTEDLDVSYRAQMVGWRFVFLAGVGVPAELPSSVPALELQQQRWAQGGIQTARRLLGRLWRGPWPLATRIEGTIHLLGHLAHPLTVALGVLLLPSALARRHLGLDQFLSLDLAVFALATLSFLIFYASAGRCRGRSWERVIPRALVTLVLGIGLTAPVSRAVLRGLRDTPADPFRRTPKTGRVTAGSGSHPRQDRTARSHSARSREGSMAGHRYGVMSGRAEQWLKVGLTLWMAISVLIALATGIYGTIPLLLLFGAGWGWLARGGVQSVDSFGSHPLEMPQGPCVSRV